eukprot:CAMPEP_0116553738 /NCGR_PEP_ID=MMETSP0397-20121206/7209_1 /TAXON_ID=216820 /ORGANISM="Cyclophora tenuis, Strain ECT3854" /LENGTH=115 /DNA_ID=CAMNT_0004078833 /DNA_START=216 /DNA_END=563 /DNA_ORIENTATION=-
MEHQKMDFPSHKKDCGKPPYRIPGKEEERLRYIVDAIREGRDVDDQEEEGWETDEGDEDDDEEEGSWESIESGEEQDEETDPKSITDVIHKFFRDKVYKKEQADESGFADMYANV